MISLTTLPGNIGQPKVAAGVAVGQACVVEAEQVQDRRVEVVDVDAARSSARMPCSSVAPWTRPPLTPPPASQDENAQG